MFVFYNPNPAGKLTGDCAVRAICRLTDKEWDEVYSAIVLQGFLHKDMPSGNSIWGAYLKRLGYKRYFLPDECPDCYSVEEFCRDYPSGRYLLVLDQHVVTVVDGNYYDTWDSGKEIPGYFWTLKGG